MTLSAASFDPPTPGDARAVYGVFDAGAYDTGVYDQTTYVNVGFDAPTPTKPGGFDE